jgi:hypothetical protein
VNSREFPGALILGLLASLAAHTVIYGGEHSMGGEYNALLVQTAIVATLGMLVGVGALAWSAGRRTLDGSILAARLSSVLPSPLLVVAAASVWFGIAEAMEPHHTGASSLAIVLCLLLAACLARALARGIVAALATIVIAVSRLEFAPRTPSWTRRPRLQPICRRLLCTRRRFARPPPIIATTRA